jgi:hypothetical protein
MHLKGCEGFGMNKRKLELSLEKSKMAGEK